MENLQATVNNNCDGDSDDAGHGYFYGKAKGNHQNPQIQNKRAVQAEGLAEIQPGQPGNASRHIAEKAAQHNARQ